MPRVRANGSRRPFFAEMRLKSPIWARLLAQDCLGVRGLGKRPTIRLRTRTVFTIDYLV